MENHYHANGSEKKAGVAILVSDQKDLKTVERHRRTLYNNKGNNLTRGSNNCKYFGTEHRSTYIHKTTINRQGS